MIEGQQATKERGRPRSAEVDSKIRQATWALIAQVGCTALTFEAIAQQVGCSRSTLYRRFSSKGALILDLFDETALSFEPVLDPAMSAREKLMTHVRNCIHMYKGDRGVAFIQIMAASRSDTTVFEAVRAHGRLVAPHYFEPLRQLAPGASDEAIAFAFHTLIGSIMHHVAARASPPTADEAERLVDAIIFLARQSCPEKGPAPATAQAAHA